MQQRYFIRQNGETKGPYSIGQLRSMWLSGTVTADTQYCEEGLEDCWLHLRVLEQELDPPPAPPPDAPPPPCPQPAPSGQPLVMNGRRIKKSEFAGAGAAVQAGGCLVFAVGGVLGATWGIGIQSGVMFGIIALILLVIGGRMAIRLVCSNCGNKLSGQEVRICPVCHCQFDK